MPTLPEIVNTLTPEARNALIEEMANYQEFLNLDVKNISPEKLSQLLSKLAKEKQELSVNLIKLETQLSEKEKEIERQTQALFEKYQISDISQLEAKQKELEDSLTAQLDSLKEVMTQLSGGDVNVG